MILDEWEMLFDQIYIVGYHDGIENMPNYYYIAHEKGSNDKIFKEYHCDSRETRKIYKPSLTEFDK